VIFSAPLKLIVPDAGEEGFTRGLVRVGDKSGMDHVGMSNEKAVDQERKEVTVCIKEISVVDGIRTSKVTV
jgi:hypothetical protein